MKTTSSSVDASAHCRSSKTTGAARASNSSAIAASRRGLAWATLAGGSCSPPSRLGTSRPSRLRALPFAQRAAQALVLFQRFLAAPGVAGHAQQRLDRVFRGLAAAQEPQQDVAGRTALAGRLVLRRRLQCRAPPDVAQRLALH